MHDDFEPYELDEPEDIDDLTVVEDARPRDEWALEGVALGGWRMD